MSVLLNIEVVDLSKAGTILIQNQQTHNGDIQIQPEIIASYFKPNRVTYSFVNGSHYNTEIRLDKTDIWFDLCLEPTDILCVRSPQFIAAFHPLAPETRNKTQ